MAIASAPTSALATRVTSSLGTIIAEEGYLRAVLEQEPWVSAAKLICKRESITPNGPLKRVSTGHFPVVLAPPDRYLKLYSSWRGGVQNFMAPELHAFEVLGRDPSLPIPTLLGAGRVTEEWQYVVISGIDGGPFTEQPGGVDPSALNDVIRWAGRFVRQLHAVHLGDDERAEERERFRRHVRWLLGNLTDVIAARAGWPVRLVEQIEGWVVPLDELMPDDAPIVPLHGDLLDRHIYGQPQDGRWEPTGVIDLNRFIIGHPLFDLGLIWRTLLGGSAELLGAFMKESGLPGYGEPDFPRSALTWAMLQSPNTVRALPGLDAIGSLDELAERSFAA